MCVSQDGSNELFVDGCDGFLGVTEGCVGQCTEDVQASFGFGVYSLNVGPERQSFVVGHSKDGGGGLYGDRYVV